MSQLSLGRVAESLSFDSPVPSLSFDEWCILSLALVAASAENVAAELKPVLANSTKIDGFLLKCGITTGQFKALIELMLPNSPCL